MASTRINRTINCRVAGGQKLSGAKQGKTSDVRLQSTNLRRYLLGSAAVKAHEKSEANLWLGTALPLDADQDERGNTNIRRNRLSALITANKMSADERRLAVRVPLLATSRMNADQDRSSCPVAWLASRSL